MEGAIANYVDNFACQGNIAPKKELRVYSNHISTFDMLLHILFAKQHTQ